MIADVSIVLEASFYLLVVEINLSSRRGRRDRVLTVDQKRSYNHGAYTKNT